MSLTRFDNIFDKAARALLLLAKQNRQVVVEDKWIDELLKAYHDEADYIALAAADMLNVLTLAMTGAQSAEVRECRYWRENSYLSYLFRVPNNAPTVLSNDNVQAGVEEFKRHLVAYKTGEYRHSVVYKGEKYSYKFPLWEWVFKEFDAITSSLTASHVDVILPLMADIFMAPPEQFKTLLGVEKHTFENNGLALFRKIAPRMSDPQVEMALSVVENVLDRNPLAINTQGEAHHTLAPLLKRVNKERRAPHINRILRTPQSDSQYIVSLLDAIVVLAEDMNEIEAEFVLQRLQELHEPDYFYNYRFPLGQELFSALIHRLSKDRLLLWTTHWKNIPWLFLRCLYSRTHDFDNDALMNFMPQVIQFLDRNNNGAGFVGVEDMAQAILISFTSRPTVTLTEYMLFLIYEIVVDNPYGTAVYNVWYHLMTLGKYNLRPVLPELYDDGLTPLLQLIEAASSDEPTTATPLVSQAPQTSSISVISTGQSFFRIIPRQPQPSPPDLTRARPQ